MENKKEIGYLRLQKSFSVYRAPTILLSLALSAGLLACNKHLQPTELSYADYTIAPAGAKDSALVRLLAPYRDSVDYKMNAVVATANATLVKKAPTGSLGNFMADAVLEMARRKFARPVDFAIVNYGGIRSNELAGGSVTRGKIFELMPFDNLLVLQVLSGPQVQQLLDFIAARGGWPVAGVSFSISNKKATNIAIGGKPFDVQQNYTLANSDYVANGGDDAGFLRSIAQVNSGYLIRDALFDYVLLLQQQGKQIEANNEMRINHAQ